MEARDGGGELMEEDEAEVKSQIIKDSDGHNEVP